jgi:hypothetical protein
LGPATATHAMEKPFATTLPSVVNCASMLGPVDVYDTGVDDAPLRRPTRVAAVDAPL